MARVWAQEWRTNTGEAVWSLHKHESDIIAFGHAYNMSAAPQEKLNQVGPAKEVISKHFIRGHGTIVNRRF